METNYYDLRENALPTDLRSRLISEAAECLKRGGVVAIPTETVYGLGANALDAQAVRKIFAAKGRPQDNPLILHVPGAAWLPLYCEEVPPLAYLLARKFWPGPLTMILKHKPVVPAETTAGLDTVGVRCPNHAVTLAIIREAGVPIAAPSANTSGRPSCTTAQDVLEDMDGKIDAVVDGGPCAVGVESTILDLTVSPPRLLRPGGLPVEELEQLTGPIVWDDAVRRALREGEKPKAPGMKYRHYAPKAPVTVITGAPVASAAEILRRAGEHSGVICFEEFVPLFDRCTVHSLGPAGDKQMQARRVFDALRTFDGSDVTEIYAQCPDEGGLGLAICNRLKKAAGFHVEEAAREQVVLGLTGGTGAGKTSALQAVSALGGLILDCDAIYHEMLEKDEALLAELKEQFPAAFPDGSLARKLLGQEVFGNAARLETLNEITYRHLVPEVERALARTDAKLCAIDAVNLTESGLARLCDRTVAVTSPAPLRLQRIMARDGISEEYARLRLAAQKDDDFYRRPCDLELRNDAPSAAAFEEKAKAVFMQLIETIEKEKQNG